MKRKLILHNNYVIGSSWIADNPLYRLIGLLGKKTLEADECMLITPCHFVHTIGMSFSIDLVFLDMQGNILKVAHDVPPNRFRGCRIAKSVLECPSGYAVFHNLTVGQQLNIA